MEKYFSTIIRSKSMLQYFCLYLFLICHDASIYRENTIFIRIGIILFCSTIIIFQRKISSQFLIFVIIMSAYLIGRTEFQLWLNYIECILITHVVLNIDKKNFCNRFLKITFVLAIISLFFYSIGLFKPNILLSIFNQTNNVEWSYYGEPYFLRGRFLYTVRQMELERNNSIFTEPGLFQMILIDALFILLFMRNSLENFSNKKISFYTLILFITVITTGSTTGYLALIMLFTIYIINNRKIRYLAKNKKEIKRMFKYIIFLALIGVLFLGIDLLVLKQKSIIYTFFIRKIMEMFSNGTSGHARTSMIAICSKIAVENFWGAGEDYVSAILRLLDDGANGGILIHSFASIGIFPVLLILLFYFKRILIKYVPLLNALLIIGIYLNTSLAQSRLLYPSLLIIPIIYSNYCKYNSHQILIK